MLYNVQIIGRNLIIRLQGDLDVHTAPIFRSEVEEALRSSGATNLILNLKSVDFIDSSGLGAILGRYKKIMERRGQMAITQPKARIRTLLELSGLRKIIPIFDSEKAVLELWEGGVLGAN